MLQAMNTGHDGSMTTVHANTARDALGRIEQMVTMTGIDFPQSASATRSPPACTSWCSCRASPTAAAA
jgi:Flp pilus assembly CpaF family ATPase